MTKRLFDSTLALVALPFTLPLMVIVALLIKLESQGPVLFKQKRVGLYGHDFTIYKFRSMVIDASDDTYFTQANDPRITSIGRLIRKTSLDELPQLFNVIKGDMSLVGPRPNVAQQRDNYTQQEWDKRNSVRPGITGLAQAVIRSSGTPEQRTHLDLEYVDKMSVLFDIRVMLLTLKQIFISRGGN